MTNPPRLWKDSGKVSKRILITGYIGFGNAGDEAIAGVLVRHLKECIPDAQITIPSGNPRQTATAFDVRAIPWQDPLALTEAVRATDLTIIGGGGLFQDYWGIDPATALSREQWGLSFYVTPALLSAVYGKPVMLYAVGIGPLFSEFGRKYTKIAADIASKITVRDAGSKALLEEYGVAGERVTVTADPAFDLQADASVAGFDEVVRWKSGGPAIAVCLRNWRFGADQTFCERQIAAALDEVVGKTGGRLLFVPFHVDPPNDDDLAVGKRMLSRVRCPESAAVLSRDCSPAMLAGIIGQADAVLGMRLHSLILAVNGGVPFVGIQYDPKIDALAGLTGFQENIVSFGGIEPEDLARRILKAIEGKEGFRELAAPLAEELRGRARENAQIAAELLESMEIPVDYGPDARLAIGRMLGTQVATNESLLERIERCCELLGQPVAGLRPFEMANSLAQKAASVRDQAAQVGPLQTELANSRQEIERLGHEGERVRQEADGLREECRKAEAARKEQADLAQKVPTLEREMERIRRARDVAQDRLTRETEKSRRLSSDFERAHHAAEQRAAEIAQLTKAADALERRIAGYESKSLGGICKRGLQASLDLLQILTPSPLRRAVRRYYLDWFYFRVYPEKRTGGMAPN